MEHQIRTVDAVILTHGHADAIAGLGQSLVPSSTYRLSDLIDYLLVPSRHSRPSSDDLRAFNQPSTPGGPKPPPLQIHLSAQTLSAISSQYPYLVDKNKATGGGDVPTLDWRVWGDEMSKEEGEGEREGILVAGVRVLPLKGEVRRRP